jgi:hypothetical protein
MANPKERRSVLDGLIGKIQAESITDLDFKISGNSGAGVVSPRNPLVSPTGTPTMPTDPFKMKEKVRQAKRAEILRRHNKGMKDWDKIDDEVADDDLKSNLDFVDENKHSTMEWNEPDGSKSTLKFDENGTLVGKDTPKKVRRT